MIYISSLRNLKDTGLFDESWMIVRSLKQPIPNTIHVPELSPSPELFKTYLRLKKNWQWTDTNFRDIYVVDFLQQIKNDSAARTKLNKLCRKSKEGKNICLVCFCEKERLCHRSIIAGLLQGVGLDVCTEDNTDYSSYYRKYSQQ